MCLDTKWNKAKKDQWLKSKSKAIIVYKVVIKNESGGYLPSNFGVKPFYKRRMNLINEGRDLIGTYRNRNSRYKPYFHLFVTEEAARKWASDYHAILKCEVPKKDIKTIGTQDRFLVIVTKAFKIVEEVKQCV